MLTSAKLKVCITWFTYFLDLLYISINVSSFITVEYACQILGKWTFLVPPICEQSHKRPILNRIKNNNSNFKTVKHFSPFLSHTQKYTNSTFSSWILFFHCLSPSSEISSKLNPHSEDLFLILRSTRFNNRFFIWIVTSLKSTWRYHRCNSLKSFIFFAVHKTGKISYSKKDIFNKTFTCPHPIITTPTSLSYNRKI